MRLRERLQVWMRRALIGSSLASSSLLLVLGSSCGATVRDEAGDPAPAIPDAGSGGSAPSTDAAVEAAPDTSTGGPFGPWCQDGQQCSSIGETCTNGCGFPCVCLATPTQRLFSCYEPPTGTRCDPAMSGVCWYAERFDEADADPDAIGVRHGLRGNCICSERFGEPYWVCTGRGDVCPVVGPETGESCEGFPAGLVCGYDDPSGWRGCECDLAHTWQCSA